MVVMISLSGKGEGVQAAMSVPPALQATSLSELDC
jgi:hypothetical protein